MCFLNIKQLNFWRHCLLIMYTLSEEKNNYHLHCVYLLRLVSNVLFKCLIWRLCWKSSPFIRLYFGKSWELDRHRIRLYRRAAGCKYNCVSLSSLWKVPFDKDYFCLIYFLVLGSLVLWSEVFKFSLRNSTQLSFSESIATKWNHLIK